MKLTKENTKTEVYDLLKRYIQAIAQKRGGIPQQLSRAEMVSWVYGNASMDNPAITLKMIEHLFEVSE